MIDVASKPGVSVISIGDGKTPNLLSVDTLSRLHSAIDSLADDTSVRSVIITGRRSRFFIAGADINELRNLDEHSAVLFARLGQALFTKMEALDKIIIAAVDGYCMGGGLDLMLACDLSYATERSVFAHPGVRMGIITGFGGTSRLPEAVGPRRAANMFFSGCSITAKQAVRCRLINGVLEPQELMNHCFDTASRADRIPLDDIALWKRAVARI